MVFQALPRLDTYSTPYLIFCSVINIDLIILGRSCCGKENESKPYKVS